MDVLEKSRKEIREDTLKSAACEITKKVNVPKENRVEPKRFIQRLQQEATKKFEMQEIIPKVKRDMIIKGEKLIKTATMGGSGSKASGFCEVDLTTGLMEANYKNIVILLGSDTEHVTRPEICN